MSVSSLSNNRPALRPSTPPPSVSPSKSVTHERAAQVPAGEAQRQRFNADRYEAPKDVSAKSKLGGDTHSSQPHPLEFLQKSSGQPQDLAADSSSSTQGVQGTDSLGRQKLSADAFLAQGPHSSDKVYPELSYKEDGLGKQKQQVWDAAKAAGANDSQSAILVAQYMQEGNRDGTKDSQGDSANYGPFNLNGGMLKQFGGVSSDQLSQLNGSLSDSLGANVKAALTAMNTMGAAGYLDDVRAGITGYNDPSQRISHDAGVRDDDTEMFGRNIANAADKVLADAKNNDVGNDQRYAGDVPHLS